MCMSCGNKSAKGSSYTPKKSGGSKGSYTPKSTPSLSSSYGKPQVRISFSGKK